MLLSILTILTGLVCLLVIGYLYRMYRKSYAIFLEKQKQVVKGGTLLLVLFASMGVSPAQIHYAGHTPVETSMPAINVQLRDEQLLVSALGLSDRESAAFLPFYTSYQARIQRLCAQYPLVWRDPYSLTEDKAWFSVERYLQFQKKRARIDKRFVRQLRSVLPSVKVVHFLWLESQLNSSNLFLAEEMEIDPSLMLQLP